MECDDEHVYVGTVSRIDGLRQGFIRCPETYAIYRNDIYIPQTRLRTAWHLRVGMRVAFRYKLVKGRPIVVELFT